jgi:hypothetical protein
MTADKPTISASLLAEYAHAAAPRRKAIIELMRDTTFEPFKNWYGEVPGAYRQYVASGCTDDERLASLERQLVKREASSEDEDNKILKKLEALEHIRLLDHSKLLSSVEIRPYSGPQRTLAVAGVQVRINPTNILVGTKLGQSTTFIGAVKPYLKASRELPEAEGKSFAALLHWFVESELGTLGTADPALVWVTDIFALKPHRAPKAFIRQRELLEENCAEIAERWTAFGTTTARVSRPRRTSN